MLRDTFGRLLVNHPGGVSAERARKGGNQDRQTPLCTQAKLSGFVGRLKTAGSDQRNRIGKAGLSVQLQTRQGSGTCAHSPRLISISLLSAGGYARAVSNRYFK